MEENEGTEPSCNLLNESYFLIFIFKIPPKTQKIDKSFEMKVVEVRKRKNGVTHFFCFLFFERRFEIKSVKLPPISFSLQLGVAFPVPRVNGIKLFFLFFFFIFFFFKGTALKLPELNSGVVTGKEILG